MDNNLNLHVRIILLLYTVRARIVLLRGTIVNRTYGMHKNLPDIY